MKGELPPQFVDAYKTFIETDNALVEAQIARNKAREVYDKSWFKWGKKLKTLREANQAYHKELEAKSDARDAYSKARKTYDEEINNLHREECPDCPWDAKRGTIFPPPDFEWP